MEENKEGKVVLLLGKDMWGIKWQLWRRWVNVLLLDREAIKDKKGFVWLKKISKIIVFVGMVIYLLYK